MRTRLLVSLAGLALALLPALVRAEDKASKPIEVDLKSFKFPTEMAELFGYNDDQAKLFFFTNGTGEAKVKVAEDGDYEILVKASCDLALNEGAKFKVAVDGKQAGKETESAGQTKEYKFPATLKAGERKLAIEFTNDVYKEGEYDRNLYVYSVKIRKVK